MGDLASISAQVIYLHQNHSFFLPPHTIFFHEYQIPLFISLSFYIASSHPFLLLLFYIYIFKKEFPHRIRVSIKKFPSHPDMASALSVAKLRRFFSFEDNLSSEKSLKRSFNHRETKWEKDGIIFHYKHNRARTF